MIAPIQIIGPCSLESESQMQAIAEVASTWDIPYLRAPLFKPRTHPDSFQGLGHLGLPIAQQLATQSFQLVMEVLSLQHLAMIKDLVSIVQVGTRNMQNFELLKDIASFYPNLKKAPMVMLKRSIAGNLEEWLSAASYLERYGVPSEKIILCERGTRNASAPQGITLDLALALEAKRTSNYKVIVDPSHGTKKRGHVLPMLKAILAMNFDGWMLEVHPRPEASWSDAAQAISLEEFGHFMASYFPERKIVPPPTPPPTPTPTL